MAEKETARKAGGGGQPTGKKVHTAEGASPLTGQRATGNVQTASGIATAAETRVQSSTDHFRSTDAQVGGKSTITSEVQRQPRTVEAVKTVMTGKGASPQQTATPMPKPHMSAGRTDTDGADGQGAGQTPYYPTGRITMNAVTGSMLTTAQRLRAANQTGSGYKVGHLSSTGTNVSGLMAKQALAGMSGMTIGAIAKTGAAVTNAGAAGNVLPNFAAQQTIAKANPLDSFLQNPTGLKDNLVGTAKTGIVALQGKFEQAPDLGTESIGQAINMGQTAYMTFKVSQKAVEIAPGAARGIVKTGSTALKATYDVTTTAGKATLTLAKSTAAIVRGYDKGGKVIINAPKDLFAVLKRNSLATGLNQTAVSRIIVSRVNAIKTGFYAAKGKIQTGVSFTRKSINGIVRQTGRAARVVKGIATGTVGASIVRQSMARQVRTAAGLIKTRIRTGTVGGARLLKRGVIRGGGIVIKNAPRGMFVSFKGIKFGIKNASLLGAGVLTGTDNYALQGMGHAINTAHFGIKTGIQAGKIAGRAGGYTVKTAWRTGKGIRAGYSFIKNNGLKAAFQTARKRVGQKIVSAGKSFVSAAINFVKSLGAKVVIPILLIVVIAAGGFSVITTPVMAVANIFSGIFDSGSGDVDVRNYLADPVNGVPALIPPIKDEIKDEVKDALEDTANNDVVRFKSDLTGDAFLNVYKDASGNLVIENFDTAFPSDESIISMLQPLYNAVLFTEYELEPTEAEAKALMEYMVSKIFRLIDKDTDEKCGQDLLTGEGHTNPDGTERTPPWDDPCTTCGEIHAHTDCPNKRTGTHTTWTCGTCCYYDCPGHSVTDYGTPDPVTGIAPVTGSHIEYCPGRDCTFYCAGYEYCDGHKVKTFTIAADGVYQLIDEYFQEPINTLSAIPEASRTEQQKKDLQTLKDYLQIFWIMVDRMGEDYGFNLSGNISPTTLAGIEFEPSTRRGCQEVVNAALGQVGQEGGRPFWTYYGMDERVEWCAIFVHWCMRHTPTATDKYPTTSNNAGCVAVSDWFKTHSQWADGGYTDVVAGDTIFFDWEGDGVTDHIGIVVGRSGNTVYTVEGNSGDAVRIKSYDVNSSVIYGYGLMNYN